MIAVADGVAQRYGTFTLPVRQLLSFGPTDIVRETHHWPDYVEQFGFTAEHIPELLKLATIDKEHDLPDGSHAMFAPIHAWRTLGQLKALEAIQPLTTLFQDEWNDWAYEEIPIVFALMGPESIPFIKDYLSDPSQKEVSRISILTSLEVLLKEHPESRRACIQIVKNQLATQEPNVPDLNGFLISVLVSEKEVEAFPLVEQLFASNLVSEEVVGSLEDVSIEMGVKEATPEYLAKKQQESELFDRIVNEIMSKKSFQAMAMFKDGTFDKKTPSKRKQAKMARKKNRRR